MPHLSAAQASLMVTHLMPEIENGKFPRNMKIGAPCAGSHERTSAE